MFVPLPLLMPMNPYATHYKSLACLGAPIIVGQIGTIVLGVADTLMIGNHSTPELAAAAFVNNVFALFIIFSMGFSYGLTPVVGSLFGQGKVKNIGEMVKNSLFVNTLLAALLLVVMGMIYFNIDRMGQPGELLPLMRPYFLVNLVSIPFVLWFNTFKQLSDGVADTKTPMWILVGGNTFNIVGNYALIYGRWGLPEWGLLGAGISTMASRILMASALFLVFWGRKSYRLYCKGFFHGRINRADCILLNQLGWPLGLQMGMETAAFSFSSVMVGWLGTNALAAHQVMLTVSQFFYMVYYGVGAAVAVRVSHFYGQRDYKAIHLSPAAGFHIILFIAFVVSIPVLLLRNDISGWFTDSREVSVLAARLFFPLIVYQLGDGLQITYANALRGLSDVKPLAYTAFIAYFLISLPVGYFLGIVLGWGVLGIWAAFPFGLTSAGLFYYYFFERRMKQIKL